MTGKIQQQRKYTEVVQRVMQMDLMQSLQLCMKGVKSRDSVFTLQQ